MSGYQRITGFYLLIWGFNFVFWRLKLRYSNEYETLSRSEPFLKATSLGSVSAHRSRCRTIINQDHNNDRIEDGSIEECEINGWFQAFIVNVNHGYLKSFWAVVISATLIIPFFKRCKNKSRIIISSVFIKTIKIQISMLKYLQDSGDLWLWISVYIS